MKIPHTDRAVIAEEKLREYLLNPAHRRGVSKARLLISMGYSADNWKRLETDLRIHHLSTDVAVENDSEYGKRYEIVALLAGPSGRAVRFRSIWQIDTGTDYPRLITIYPE